MSRRTEAVRILEYVKLHVETQVPVKYPNQPFTPPANFGAYVAVMIAPNNTVRESLGATQAHICCYGILQFDIYVKTDTGTKRLDEIEDLLMDKFSDLHLTTSDNEDIVIQQPRPILFSPKDGVLRKSVQFMFHRTEFRDSQFA